MLMNANPTYDINTTAGDHPMYTPPHLRKRAIKSLDAKAPAFTPTSPEPTSPAETPSPTEEVVRDAVLDVFAAFIAKKKAAGMGMMSSKYARRY